MRAEIDSISDLRGHLRRRGHLRGTVVQGLDLRNETEILMRQDAEGMVLLGCELEEAAARHVHETGGLLFPGIPGLPYEPYRPSLYTAEELMAGYAPGCPESHRDCLDQQVYAHYRKRREPVPLLEALAQRLHDHAIDDALADLLSGGEPRKVVAIMGGHAMARTDPQYRKVARIAQELTERVPGLLMASGGGPGAMEACHLGAWLAGKGEAALDEALSILSPAPGYRHGAWLDTALKVRDRFPDPGESLSIPTWFYGHEPPNLFATHIAKYFSNSLREEGLLAIAQHGVIYAPGSAGTIQEIFMDAAQNHYGTFGTVSPMVFLGRRYWTDEKRVYPLLQELAASRQYGEMLALADTADDVVELIVRNPPVPYRP